MTVRFSSHAVHRLLERFGGAFRGLIEVVERGVFENGAEPAPLARWKVEGNIGFRAVRVVFAEVAPGDFVIVTAMWLS